MAIYITGGAWISSAGHGFLGDGKGLKIDGQEPLIPPSREVFDTPLARYGRFDTFTKLGCTAAALALKNAKSGEIGKNARVGMIISSLFEIMDTDINYYETTLDEEGALSSPNLFSYTLPVIVLGETAVYFNLTGPTFCVGENDEGRGLNALQSAIAMINSGKADKMLVGWIDSPPPDIEPAGRLKTDRGAIFVILESNIDKPLPSFNKVSYNGGGLLINNKKTVTSIIDFFKEGDSL
ncbi:MAG: beta-ketoacyl synthase N-terminal-like domain-containing protein [bacterium]|nr:beta-ketoacyl synthase N-terminal-like domain-containing protein [bacterium]